jgi:hypothetical protein
MSHHLRKHSDPLHRRNAGKIRKQSRFIPADCIKMHHRLPGPEKTVHASPPKFMRIHLYHSRETPPSKPPPHHNPFINPARFRPRVHPIIEPLNITPTPFIVCYAVLPVVGFEPTKRHPSAGADADEDCSLNIQVRTGTRLRGMQHGLRYPASGRNLRYDPVANSDPQLRLTRKPSRISAQASYD